MMVEYDVGMQRVWVATEVVQQQTWGDVNQLDAYVEYLNTDGGELTQHPRLGGQRSARNGPTRVRDKPPWRMWLYRFRTWHSDFDKALNAQHLIGWPGTEYVKRTHRDPCCRLFDACSTPRAGSECDGVTDA